MPRHKKSRNAWGRIWAVRLIKSLRENAVQFKSTRVNTSISTQRHGSMQPGLPLTAAEKCTLGDPRGPQEKAMIETKKLKEGLITPFRKDRILSDNFILKYKTTCVYNIHIYVYICIYICMYTCCFYFVYMYIPFCFLSLVQSPKWGLA